MPHSLHARGRVLLLVLALTASAVCSSCSKEQARQSARSGNIDLAAAQHAYQATNDPHRKRDIFIAAIDSRLISRTGDVQSVAAICGTDFREHAGTTAAGLEYGIVNFAPAIESGADRMASGRVGWYCVIEYSGGQIENYWLSDLHK